METKLKKLLKKKRMTQSMLFNKIANKFETPVGQYALSEIVNGKKLNYHLITLVKICNVLKVKPHTIVEDEILVNPLLNIQEDSVVEHDNMRYNPENPKETLEYKNEGFDNTTIDDVDDLPPPEELIPYIKNSDEKPPDFRF